MKRSLMLSKTSIFFLNNLVQSIDSSMLLNCNITSQDVTYAAHHFLKFTTILNHVSYLL